mgnify:CR=1 FL=1
MQEFQATLEHQEQIIEQLNSDLSSKDDLIQRLQQKVADFERIVYNPQEEIGRLREALCELQAENDLLKAEYKRCYEEITILQSKNASLKEIIEEKDLTIQKLTPKRRAYVPAAQSVSKLPGNVRHFPHLIAPNSTGTPKST